MGSGVGAFMKKLFKKLMVFTALTASLLTTVIADDYVDINNAYMLTISELCSEIRDNFRYEDYIRVHSIALYDINKDGINELFVKIGSCEIDYTYFVFTYVNGKVDMLGSFAGGHSTLYEYTGNGISRYAVNQGCESLYTYSMTDKYQLAQEYEDYNNSNITDKSIQPSSEIEEIVVDLY